MKDLKTYLELIDVSREWRDDAVGLPKEYEEYIDQKIREHHMSILVMLNDILSQPDCDISGNYLVVQRDYFEDWLSELREWQENQDQKIREHEERLHPRPAVPWPSFGKDLPEKQTENQEENKED